MVCKRALSVKHPSHRIVTHACDPSLKVAHAGTSLSSRGNAAKMMGYGPGAMAVAMCWRSK
jgi:hypothetical protein